jgi:type I restriction enzyme S subunit
MGGEWQEARWGDIATIEYGKGLRGYQEATGAYRVFGTNGPIGWHDEPLCPFPSVIIGRKGAYRGIHFSPEPFFVIDTAFYLKPKEDFNVKWAYYELLTHDINSMDSGSAIPSTSRESFYQLPVLVPPNEDQQAIAHILGSLDDKIELNRRMNQTLEATARAIFKSWFVDFDPVRAKAEGRPTGLPDDIAALFPDSFEDSELGEIPRGWKVNTVEESAEKVACGPFGSSIKVSTFVPKGVPIISGQHLNGIRLLDQANSFITTEHAEKLKNANVYRGDVIFTHAGNIGQVAFIPETSKYDRYVLSQRQFYLRCNREIVSPFYMAHYFKSPDGQHKLLANTSSTGVPSISRPVSYLKSIKFVLPPKDLIDAFDEYVRPTHLLAAKNDDESNTLASLRDTLLPKLISGELRVPDAEKFVEEAGV